MPGLAHWLWIICKGFPSHMDATRSTFRYTLTHTFVHAHTQSSQTITEYFIAWFHFAPRYWAIAHWRPCVSICISAQCVSIGVLCAYTYVSLCLLQADNVWVGEYDNTLLCTGEMNMITIVFCTQCNTCSSIQAYCATRDSLFTVIVMKLRVWMKLLELAEKND